ncbi:hypothetical protein [Streptomyces fuscichromogenes]|uniref:Uncharacterized protein n=1 Tax=Streptomyces fuscichromogenes TaxID=1324013 RepID=A0A917X9V6_9ACTN|nr:hypothetical protein [Streptomyces fuscichromogenes]GGM98300.1 hypothetical protein GCM10011578_019110 [Streptomyces fuscichromogenes]
MNLRVGQTLCSAVDGTAVIVVRCPRQDVTLTCGGREMSPQDSAPTSRAAALTGAPANGALIGKRYATEDGALEVLCVRPGEYPLEADGTALAVKAPRPLPASD